MIVQKRTNSGVDLAKFILALCIIALHADSADPLPAVWSKLIVRGVFRLAVPYFFVASGYFLYQKLQSAENVTFVIKAYCLRLLKPLVVFEVINIVQNIISLWTDGIGVAGIVLNIGRSVIFYPYGALWFIQACIVGAILLIPFLKRKKITTAIIVGAVLYCVALLCNNYYFIIKNTPLGSVANLYFKLCVSPRNGLFVGFFYLALGMLCSQLCQKFGKRIYTLRFICLFVYVVYIAEIMLLHFLDLPAKDDGSLYITHVVLIPALFLVTLSWDVPVRQEVSVTLRNLSTGLYYLHRPLLWFAVLLCPVGVVNFIAVAFAAIVLCLLVYRTRKEPFYSLLK